MDTSVKSRTSSEPSLHPDSARLPAKSGVVATAQRPGNSAIGNLVDVKAPRGARFGISEQGTGKSLAVLERPVQPAGAFGPPGRNGPVVTLSQPTVVARRDPGYAEPYSGASRPYGDGASDSFKRASGMEGAVRDALQQEAKLLETGMDFEVFRETMQALREQNAAVAEAVRGGFSHAVRFASTD